MPRKKTETVQALRPNFAFSNLPSIVADEKAGKKGALEEERQLYAMAQSSGWKILTEHINNVLRDLDEVNRIAIEQGQGFEVIGQNTVIINSTKGVIESILNKVDDAIEACTTEEEVNE